MSSDLYYYILDDFEPVEQGFTSSVPGAAPVAFGPVTVLNEPPAGELPTALRLFVYDRPNLTTSVGEFTKKRAAGWQEQVSEVGSAEFTIGLDDPLLPLGDDQLVAIEANGVLVMSAVPDVDEYHSLSTDGPAGEEVKLSLKGHGWILNEALVYPTRGPDQLPIENDRVFSWASPEYSVAGWYFAKSFGNGLTDAWNGIDTWPNPTPGQGLDGGYGEWIWGAEGTVDHAPQGDCFFSAEFNVAVSGTYTIFFIADDRGHLYVDGQRVIETNNWVNSNENLQTLDIQLSAGVHTCRVWAQNNSGGPPGNPAGIRVAIAQRNLDGTVSFPVLNSNAAWLVTSYPLYIPSMSPGQIVRICVEEAQDRGALLGVTLNFTDEHDSDGNPWFTYNEITTKAGVTTVLGFLREMSDTYVDWELSPAGLDLSLWQLDGAGVDTGLSWHRHTDPDDASSGNLSTLTQRRQH